MMPTVKILTGDALEVLRTLQDESVQCCVSSPPYWGLRDYGVPGQMGLEKTPQDYVAGMVAVFREVKRALREDGTLWLNIGDSYSRAPEKGGSGPGNKGNCANGLDEARRILRERKDRRNGAGNLKPKDLIGIPWMLAFALRDDGWYLRQDVIWHKPNPMPESVTDRPTTCHEHIFLLAKSERYYYDAEAIKEPQSQGTHERFGKNPTASSKRKMAAAGSGIKCNNSFDAAMVSMILEGGRNKRSVWTVPSFPFSDAHFATFPPDLIKPCILAGCPVDGTVIDPFGGSGTTGEVALELGRNAILIELNPDYVEMAKRRCRVTPGLPLQ